MIYEYPDWVETFQCIAGDCPDTCCAGWEVGVDEDTKQIYETAPEPFQTRFRSVMRTDPSGGCYFQPAEHMRCPFLNDKNLCDIIIGLGPEALSMVCDEYPRYFNEIGDYQQMDMSLSCMEFGRIFFHHGDMVLRRAEDDTAGSGTADNERLLRILDVRDEMIGRMQATKQPWKEVLLSLERTYADDAESLMRETDETVWQMMRSQEMLDEKTAKVFEAAGREIRGHENVTWGESLHEPCCGRGAVLKTEESEKTAIDKAEEITRGCSGGKSTKAVPVDRAVNEAISQKNLPASADDMMDVWFRKITVYFLFRYTLDAYADGSFDPEFRLINRSLRFLEYLCLARARNQGHPMTVEDMIDVAHLYSRQVEHSEEIVAALKK